MNGSITVVDTKTLSKTDNLSKYNTDYGSGDNEGYTFNFLITRIRQFRRHGRSWGRPSSKTPGISSYDWMAGANRVKPGGPPQR
jgi:hypothetical protein